MKRDDTAERTTISRRFFLRLGGASALGAQTLAGCCEVSTSAAQRADGAISSIAAKAQTPLAMRASVRSAIPTPVPGTLNIYVDEGSGALSVRNSSGQAYPVDVSPSLAILPVERFTPGGLALSDANLQASVDAARAYAMKQGGGRIVVPLAPRNGGKWHPPPTLLDSTAVLQAGKKAGLVLRGCGYGIPMYYECPPGGGIIVAPACDIGLYIHSPLPARGDASGVLTYSRVREFFVLPEGDHQTQDAIRINAAVDSHFDNLKAKGFNGYSPSTGKRGTGLAISDDWGGDGNSQMCRFTEVSAIGNNVNYHVGKLHRAMGSR